jgi:hypothetical protein
MSEFQSVYTGTKNLALDVNNTTNQSVLKDVETKSGSVFAPATATRVLMKKEERLTPQQIKQIEGLGIKVALMNSKTTIPKQTGLVETLKRRYLQVSTSVTERSGALIVAGSKAPSYIYSKSIFRIFLVNQEESPI